MNIQNIVEQCLTDSREWFGRVAEDVKHHALALGGEVGELQNIIKKIDRGTNTLEGEREKIASEVADIFIYLCNFAGVLGIDLEAEYEKKRAENEKRFGTPAAATNPTPLGTVMPDPLAQAGY